MPIERTTTNENTQESEMSAEKRAEAFRRISEVIAALDEAVKDQFRGLTAEQIKVLAETNYLTRQVS